MIVVSSCLLGNHVKYSGGSNDNELIMKYSRYFTSICPECLGELPIPRPPAELQGGDGHAVLAGKAGVFNKEGLDVTANFLKGSQRALDFVLEHKVKIAILKANSPSCGNARIYDGTFSGDKIPGQGVAAALLTQNSVKVYSEKDINEDMLQKLIAMDKNN